MNNIKTLLLLHFLLEVEPICVDEANDCAYWGSEECKDPSSTSFGSKSVSVRGFECYPWIDTSYDDTKGYPSNDNNFCRNPDGWISPWCFTTFNTGENYQWDQCFKPCEELLPCVDESRDCAYYGRPSCYSMTLNTTKTVTQAGVPCQHWNLDAPQDHDRNFIGNDNFCRNPWGTSSGPGCYTTNSTKRSDECYIDCASIDDCLHNPCWNDGTCIDELEGYKCNCKKGSYGKDCEIAKPTRLFKKIKTGIRVTLIGD